MFGHLSEETLMDVVDGTANPSARAHVESCLACRSRVAGAAEAWTLAQGSNVPEPSPMYWEAFRRQVDRRIQAEGPGRHRWLGFLVPVAAAIAMIAVLLPRINGPEVVPAPSPRVSPSVLPSWSALPAAEDDAGLEVLRAALFDGSDVSLAYERSGIQEWLSDLSEEESQELAERLRAEKARMGTL